MNATATMQRMYQGTLLENQRVAGSAHDRYLKMLETLKSNRFRRGAVITATAVALGLAALAADVPKKVADHFSIPMSSIEEAVKYGSNSGSQYQ